MPFSELDLQNMQARLNKNTKTKAPADAEHDEEILHNKIITYCKDRRWIYFRSSMAHRTHATLGTPDFIILADKGRVLFIECKSKTGKLSTEQLGIQLAAKILGHTVHAVRSMREFTAILETSL